MSGCGTSLLVYVCPHGHAHDDLQDPGELRESFFCLSFVFTFVVVE